MRNTKEKIKGKCRCCNGIKDPVNVAIAEYLSRHDDEDAVTEAIKEHIVNKMTLEEKENHMICFYNEVAELAISNLRKKPKGE